jgi:hypothetical protein
MVQNALGPSVGVSMDSSGHVTVKAASIFALYESLRVINSEFDLKLSQDNVEFKRMVNNPTD